MLFRSSSCGKWGPLFIAVRGPLTTAASLVAEHRLQTRRLSKKLLFLIRYLYIVPEWNEIEKAYNFVAPAFGENLKESRKSTLFDKSCFIKKIYLRKFLGKE